MSVSPFLSFLSALKSVIDSYGPSLDRRFPDGYCRKSHGQAVLRYGFFARDFHCGPSRADLTIPPKKRLPNRSSSLDSCTPLSLSLSLYTRATTRCTNLTNLVPIPLPVLRSPLGQYDIPSSLPAAPLSFPAAADYDSRTTASSKCGGADAGGGVPPTPVRPMIDSKMPTPLEMSDEGIRGNPILDYTTPDHVRLLLLLARRRSLPLSLIFPDPLIPTPESFTRLTFCSYPRHS